MLPNLYKIAGELTALCMHVASRTIATHALSIFCDHSDVMAVRQAGFAILASSSVQESHDFACIGQAASLRSRIPFLHFFDGFRYAANRQGRGPAWSNSLFEDNAEFGFGLRLAVDGQRQRARELARKLGPRIGGHLVEQILEADQKTELGLRSQRERVAELRRLLEGMDGLEAKSLHDLADYLVRKSIWLVGGDGWAYDIGYGGLDHVLAQREDVNVLVLDTEVYSNTDGQQSKATPLGAAAKFAIAGKETPKKDLGMEAMSYGHVYVARVAFGANMNQLIHAFLEADSYSGPSLIIAHSPCIAHGYELRFGAEQQKRAVLSGAWPLYRFDPRRIAEDKPPLHLDSREPTIPISEYMKNETRFRMVERIDRERYRALAAAANKEAKRRFSVYKQLAEVTLPDGILRREEEPGERDEAHAVPTASHGR